MSKLWDSGLVVCLVIILPFVSGYRYGTTNQYNHIIPTSSPTGQHRAVAYGSGNVALNKRTVQSSLLNNHDVRGASNHAVDGNTNTNWLGQSCTHTNNDLHAWWSVDLGQVFTVHAVTIFNRGDCCSSRLSDFYIGLTDLPPTVHAPTTYGPNYRVCTHHRGAQTNLIQTYHCNEATTGRYLVVQLLGHNYLTLCEVQVQATTGGLVNLAAYRPTYQSSEAYGGVASRAVDGDVNPIWSGGSCTHTTLMNDPWWAVDLGSTNEVHAVSLVNRLDCCGERLTNFNIGVTSHSPKTRVPSVTGPGYPLCVQQYGPQRTGATTDYTCQRPRVGRYVIVQIRGFGTLTLCEVIVFGQD